MTTQATATQATVIPIHRRCSKPPSFRRKPESRKSPGKERTGYRWFWIPAFAGTTVLCGDCLVGQWPALSTGVGIIIIGIIIGRGGFITRPTFRCKDVSGNGLPYPHHSLPKPGRVINPPLPSTTIHRNRAGQPSFQTTVVPAKAGIQEIPGERTCLPYKTSWIPAFAGTTVLCRY